MFSLSGVLKLRLIGTGSFCILLLTLLGGCDSSTANYTSAERIDLSLNHFEYQIDSSENDTLNKIATIDLSIDVSANEAQDVMVDFYLLPIDEETNDMALGLLSSDISVEELSEDRYFHISRLLLEGLQPGLNQRSEQVLLPKNMLKGQYEIVPIIDPYNELDDSNPDNNVPEHISRIEPDESMFEDIGSLPEKSQLPIIDIIPSPEEELVMEDAVTISEPEFSDSALLFEMPKMPEDASIWEEDYFGQMEEKLIRGSLEINSQDELTGTVYLIPSIEIWGDNIPLQIWNSTLNSYAEYHEVHLDSITTHHVDYEVRLDPETHAFLIDYIREMNTDLDQPYELEFTITVMDEEQFNVDRCGQLDCSEELGSGIASQIKPYGFWSRIKKSTVKALAYVKEIEEKQKNNPQLSWDKSVGQAKKVQGTVYVKGGAAFDPLAAMENKNATLVGATAEAGIKVTTFKAENNLLALVGELGISGNKKFNKNIELKILDNSVFSLVQACGAATNACEEKDDGFKKSWEETKETEKVTIPLGPVSLSAKAGVTGELSFDAHVGIDGTLYFGGDLVKTKLNAFLKGGVDYKAVYAGVVANMIIVDTTLNAKVYASAWDRSMNLDPKAGATASLNLDSISGKLGGFAEVENVKWCKKGISVARVMYPCGLRTKEYTYWIYKTKSLFVLKDKSLFDKSWPFNVPSE